jgi:enamine deaminase RidA (YjgF/YER057c/UK114 family)
MSTRITWIAGALVVVSALGMLAVAQQKTSGPVRRGAAGGLYSTSIVVPPGCSTVYLPGSGAWKYGQPLKEDFGDTETQTEITIQGIQAELQSVGMSLSDVVLFRGTLGPDPAHDNKIDMDGYSKSYRRHFGSPDQPNKPVRATYEGRITVPGLLVEIEVIAAGHCSAK